MSMSKTSTFLIIFGIIILVAGGWLYTKWQKYAPSSYVEEITTQNGTSTQTVNTNTGEKTPGAPSLTMATVALHKDASSCYTVISGKVYDLTLWVNMHPGGKQAILSLCGTDGTVRFNAKHGGDTKPTGALARFYIGNLAQ